MKTTNKHNKKIIKFLNGRAFYVVLCLSFLAIGIATWSGVEGFKNTHNKGNQSQSSDTAKAPSLPITQKDPVDTNSTENRNETAELPDNTPSSEPTESESQKTEQTAAPVATVFINPVLGEVIKNYSETELQYSMTMKDMRLHKAVDIAADVGTPVVASGEGIVTEVLTDPMYGVTVVIDHGNGITVKYCGLKNAPFVSKGDTVDSSKQLGVIDVIPCESVEPRHLHLEFFKDGKAVSPLNYIMQ